MKTILVVDDEFAIVEGLTDLLQDEGYRVISAFNGRDGLAWLEKESPDLVLVDFMMPIADGLEMIRGLRAIPQHVATPVILMSAASKNVVANARDDRGVAVSGFLSKPFQLEKLLETVVRLIGKSERDE